MAYADVLFLDDCSDESNDTSGYNIEEIIKDLGDPATRKAAMHALSAHPYASDDLVESPAWPTFCRILSTVLADPDPEVSSAAVTFTEKVFRGVRSSKPHELADLCLALAAHIVGGQTGDSSAPCGEIDTPLESTSECASSKQACKDRAQVAGDSGGDRAAVRAAAVRLLLRCLQALPRVWATFRDPLLQLLWDAVCPLLQVELRSSASSIVQQLALTVSISGSGSVSQGQPAHHAAAASFPSEGQRRDGPSFGCADMPLAAGCRSAADQQAPGVRPAAPRPEDAWQLCGPLAEVCSAEGWSGDWWKAWSAPARPARWLPGALEKHGVLPGLIEVCRRLAESPERTREATPAEAFAVQVGGSVLALSLGRKLFPISNAIPTESSQQVTVENAIASLSSIGTHPLRAPAPGMDCAWTVAEVALDGVHLICRDDSADFRILLPRNVKFLAAQLDLCKQFAGKETFVMEVERRLDSMLGLLARTAYGRSLLGSCV